MRKAIDAILAIGVTILVLGFAITTFINAGAGVESNPNLRAAAILQAQGLGENAGKTWRLNSAKFDATLAGFNSETGMSITVPSILPSPAGADRVVMINGTPTGSVSTPGQVETIPTQPATLPAIPGSIESHVGYLHWLGIDPKPDAQGFYNKSAQGALVEEALRYAEQALSNNPNDQLGLWVKEQATQLKVLLDQMNQPLSVENASALKGLAEKVLQANPRILKAYYVRHWATLLTMSGKQLSDQDLWMLNLTGIEIRGFVSDQGQRTDGALLEVVVYWPRSQDNFPNISIILSAGQLNKLFGQRPLEGTLDERAQAVESNGGWTENSGPRALQVSNAQSITPSIEALPLPQRAPAEIEPQGEYR